MNQMSGLLGGHGRLDAEVEPGGHDDVVALVHQAWMCVAYSDGILRDDDGRLVGSEGAAPSLAPTNVYSLKFLSLTVPTSVTTPIFIA